MTTKEWKRSLAFGGFEGMFDKDDRRRGSMFLTAVRSALLLVGGLLTGAISTSGSRSTLFGVRAPSTQS